MQTRRDTLRHAAALAGLLAASGVLAPAAQAAYNKAAFDARTVQDAVRALAPGALVESREVVLSTLDVSENGQEVPLGVSTSLPGVRQLLLLVEKNPAPLVAAFGLTDAVEANLAIRTKMSQTSDVYGVAVMVDGRMLVARKNVRVQMRHEMESGQRKDAGGRTIAAWHIQEVTVLHNDRPVLTAQWGPGVSKNPYLQFTIKGAKAGDRVAILWNDNRSASRRDEAVVG